jgi:protoporphyrinogen oxidase
MKVVIIGGGFAGFSAAIELLDKGYEVTIVEGEERLGGLAYSFKKNGKEIHTGYHQILSTDKPLIDLMKKLNLYKRITWKNININFLINDKIFNFKNPLHLINLPFSLFSKARFGAFMAYCFARRNWNGLEKVSAKSWISKMAGKDVLKAIFDPLINIKFGMSSAKVSAAWVGSRLHSREGSSAFGAITGKNWTVEICNAAEKYIKKKKGRILFNERVTGLEIRGGRVKKVKTSNHELEADYVISTVSPPILKRIVDLKDPLMDKIEYIDSISTIISVKKTAQDFYWLVCLSPRKFMGGLFNLSDLNPKLGKNEIILNFFTNVDRGSELLKKSDDELIATYKKEYKEIYGEELKINWYKINRIPYVSAKFVKGYRNPAIQTKIDNLLLAGNYRSYPSVTSTGTAIQTGIEAAELLHSKQSA